MEQITEQITEQIKKEEPEAWSIFEAAGVNEPILLDFSRDDLKDLFSGNENFILRRRLWKILEKTKNQETELVSTLQGDLSRSEIRVKELELALRGTENGEIVIDLIDRISQLTISLSGKKELCEALIKKIDKLEHAEMRKAENQEKMLDSIDGKEIKVESYNPWEDPAIKQRMDELGEENGILRNRCEELANSISNSEEEMKKLLEANERFTTQLAELTTTQRDNVVEIQRKTLQEKEKLVKEITEYKKKCDGFFQQVMGINSKQKESEEELDRMKRAFDHQVAEIEEKKALNNLMSESLNIYEDDFRRENEEKAKCQKQLHEVQQECERSKRENQSHTATIRHLEDEFESMNKMWNDERKRTNNILKSKGTGTMFELRNNNYSALAAAGRRTFMPENRQMQVVAEGGGNNESDSQHKKYPYSMPTTNSEASSAPSLIECPYCSRSYPYHLIEGHVQDCMEDNTSQW